MVSLWLKTCTHPTFLFGLATGILTKDRRFSKSHRVTSVKGHSTCERGFTTPQVSYPSKTGTIKGVVSRRCLYTRCNSIVTSNRRTLQHQQQSVKNCRRFFSASPPSSHSPLHLSLSDSAFRRFLSPSEPRAFCNMLRASAATASTVPVGRAPR